MMEEARKERSSRASQHILISFESWKSQDLQGPDTLRYKQSDTLQCSWEVLWRCYHSENGDIKAEEWEEKYIMFSHTKLNFNIVLCSWGFLMNDCKTLLF